MVIQTERIWLFETIVADPFIFNKTGGVDITMSETDDRSIELLDIDTAIFFIDTVLKGGLQVQMGYGGEDHLPNTVNGKNNFQYTLEFNVPLEEYSLLEQLTGKEFSVVGMRRDLSMFACFARFVAADFDIDNQIIQRIQLNTEPGNHILFELNNLNVTELVNVIGSQPPNFPLPFENVTQFEYPIESALN